MSTPVKVMQHGFSLIEVLVAMTIGMLISAAMALAFMKTNTANREQFKASQQIESGRFAVESIVTDLRHAGYYGEFGGPLAATGFAGLPDPCDLTLLPQAILTTASTDNPLAFHVQGSNAATPTAQATIPNACLVWIDATSLRAGSDIVVVRRLDTAPLIDLEAATPRTTATPPAGVIYAQTTSDTLAIQYGAGAAIDRSMDAGGAAAALQRKDYTQAAAGVPPLRPTIAADIRKLHVHVYYVANCRDGSGPNGRCVAGDDSIPTLKRLELTAAGGNATMTIVPLVDGIEFMKIRYGVDTDGDGAADGYTAAPAFADWQNVVQAEVRVLARNLESSSGTDLKTYDLGAGLSFTPAGASSYYKRHLFLQQTYLSNAAGLREK